MMILLLVAALWTCFSYSHTACLWFLFGLHNQHNALLLTFTLIMYAQTHHWVYLEFIYGVSLESPCASSELWVNWDEGGFFSYPPSCDVALSYQGLEHSRSSWSGSPFHTVHWCSPAAGPAGSVRGGCDILPSRWSSTRTWESKHRHANTFEMRRSKRQLNGVTVWYVLQEYHVCVIPETQLKSIQKQ